MRVLRFWIKLAKLQCRNARLISIKRRDFRFRGFTRMTDLNAVRLITWQPQVDKSVCLGRHLLVHHGIPLCIGDSDLKLMLAHLTAASGQAMDLTRMGLILVRRDRDEKFVLRQFIRLRVSLIPVYDQMAGRNRSGLRAEFPYAVIMNHLLDDLGVYSVRFRLLIGLTREEKIASQRGKHYDPGRCQDGIAFHLSAPFRSLVFNCLFLFEQSNYSIIFTMFPIVIGGTACKSASRQFSTAYTPE